jgi:predicted ATPase
MDREQFLEEVGKLRAAGKSIRAIALELDVHRSRVERALKNLHRMEAKELSPSLDHAPAGGRVGKETFVGRRTEMAELMAALKNALSCRGRLVMLMGEPGIGKTRTVQELAARAQASGCLVLWGNCYEGQGASPYWPWIQIIRSYVQAHDADQLCSQMGPGAADIAEIIPSLREVLPDLESPPTLEPEQARFRLFDSIATFLKNAAKSQPLALALDNLHRADLPSLLLLEFLSQEMSDASILALGTYPDTDLSPDHPLTHTLGELARHRHCQRIQLGRLGSAEVGQFINTTSGFEPPPRLVDAVYARTEGNPKGTPCS